MFKLSLNNTTHNGSSIQFSNSKFSACRCRKSNSGLPQMTFCNGVTKYLNSFNIAKFVTHFLQKFLVNIIIEPIKDNIALWWNSNVIFINLNKKMLEDAFSEPVFFLLRGQKIRVFHWTKVHQSCQKIFMNEIVFRRLFFVMKIFFPQY